ncbi:MAG: LLM class flavin-dependent oxidoreductase, partial [Candidatus Heimdallarchaeota archaeon]|nr:LLM class flavin-dependent oxidoreductase [Candidatus Heimdallarchaeota archaeon]
MKIGITLSADYFPINQLIEMVPLVDQMGYSQISVPEIWGHDAFTLLSVLTQKTKSVTLATGIVNMFSRSPGTMAMTAASLDELSGGRFTLGLGLSGPKVIENWHGMKFTQPLTRTKEYIEVLRVMLKRERLDHQTSQLGEFKDFRISMRDFRSDIPIHIAALGPKNVELTAQIADGWIPVIMPLQAMSDKIKEIHTILEKNGKDKNTFQITPFIPTVIGNEPEKIANLKGHLAYYFGGMGTFYNNMLSRIGFEKEAETIISRWNLGDVKGASDAISEDLLNEICIFGSVDEAFE